ncbi:hypothetical protein [Paraburkholderia humisilvae]|uniref:Uncharacterized protein n=1 Tax=Paraburkholderia humisilvae TaxID=627669 RepID=A0A6J5DL68_9BURK|nr:hypothetical protein [Paraburkholderia humisilvae]CAB3754723.1 hypothetical protein LMG29542_02435 [Paraburkholderia humisilvae]
MKFQDVHSAALRADADGETLVMGFKFGKVIGDQGIVKPEGNFLRFHFVEDLEAQLQSSILLDEGKFTNGGYAKMVPTSPFAGYFQEAQCL